MIIPKLSSVSWKFRCSVLHKVNSLLFEAEKKMCCFRTLDSLIAKGFIFLKLFFFLLLRSSQCLRKSLLFLEIAWILLYEIDSGCL